MRLNNRIANVFWLGYNDKQSQLHFVLKAKKKKTLHIHITYNHCINNINLVKASNTNGKTKHDYGTEAYSIPNKETTSEDKEDMQRHTMTSNMISLSSSLE